MEWGDNDRPVHAVLPGVEDRAGAPASGGWDSFCMCQSTSCVLWASDSASGDEMV
jgi:hypothetical protein